jgi:FkbM family methyltransferase
MPNLRRVIDALRHQVNRRLGFDVVRASGQHTLRTHLGRVLSDYAIDTVLDVGANEGGFGALLRSQGFGGEILSFEPVAGAFAKLASLAARDGRWTAFDFALGAESGEAQINVSKFSQFSSILNSNEYGNRWESMEVQHQQRIRIRTLDECLESGLVPGGRRYLLKMDTQGFDLEVFKGAEASMPSICCVLSELSLIPLYHGMPHYLDALAVYESKGFSVSGFYPITRNADLVLNEVDCMLVNAGSRKPK